MMTEKQLDTSKYVSLSPSPSPSVSLHFGLSGSPHLVRFHGQFGDGAHLGARHRRPPVLDGVELQVRQREKQRRARSAKADSELSIQGSGAICRARTLPSLLRSPHF